MKIGEVGLLTNDVTMLTIYNDGSIKNDMNQNICLAFTVVRSFAR